MITQEEIERRFNLWQQGYWEIPEGLDTSNFDFEWRPEPYDRPYVHQFGTQWQKTGGPRFVIPENEGIKYQETQFAIRLPHGESRCWRPLRSNVWMDLSWHPDDTDPPYIYVFGNQWYDCETMPTIQYRVKGATEKKYITDVTAKLLPNKDRWESPDDIADFDYSWVPHPDEPPFIWQFGTQWQKNGGPKYVCDNATVVKYTDIIKATKASNPEKRNWRPLVSNIEFDWSWHPDEDEPPYIYVFGNQHYGPDLMPTLLYRVKGATEKKYMTDMPATLVPDMNKWVVPDDIEEGFDFSWVPHPHEPEYIWQFGTQHQKNGGPQYIGRDATVKKYTDEQIAIKKPNKDKRNWRPLVSNIEFDWSWHPDEDEPPFNYVFGNQWYDGITMPTVTYRVPGATDKKFIDTVKATLLPTREKWIVPDEVDDTGWDYSWVPNPNDGKLIYQFGTQHQKTGGHRYVCDNAPNIIKYTDVMRSTRVPDMRKWRIIEEIDRDTFDFSWHPDDTDGAFNYIFGNKFHTPEFMPTVTYRGKNTANNKYITDTKADLRVDRKTFEDSIFEQAIVDTFETKYVHYQNSEHPVNYQMLIPEYDPQHIYLHIIDNSAAVIPKGFKAHLYDSLTDYPYIKRHNLGTCAKPLDIVFFSNGETCAEENYQHLLSLNLPNRIVRVDGVNGRVASQHAAANASETPWYFLVNAKLKVDKDFDFNWQPDIMKSRRHYIFKAKNTINNLEYGHMAIVANNKNLTLATLGVGLDFTMESKTEVVDMLSGSAVFNSEWDVWRTAFRECIKLRHAKDSESKSRLTIWTTVADGEFGQSSLQGARDAVEYYESVDGDFDKLKLSYDWQWLKEYYHK